MLISKKEFELMINAIDFNIHPELISMVDEIENRHKSNNKKKSEYIKQKRKENPEYGHSKIEIDYYRSVKNAKGKLGV